MYKKYVAFIAVREFTFAPMDHGAVLTRMKCFLKRRAVIDFDHFLDELINENLIQPTKERRLRAKKDYPEQIECAFSELSEMNPRATYTHLLTILDKMGREDIKADLTGERH